MLCPFLSAFFGDCGTAADKGFSRRQNGGIVVHIEHCEDVNVVYKFLILYLVVLNIIGFAGMGRDKRKAATHQPRTPERRLIAVAVLGGSVGSLVGMSAFRHKTRHLKFTLGLPLILLFQILAVGAAVVYFG